MKTETYVGKASAAMREMSSRLLNEFHGDDNIRVAWLSITLFFTVGGYWLLRSIKDPIMSTIDGVCIS